VDEAADGTRAPRFQSYAAFGEEFFRRAVTEDRLLGAVNVLAGQPIRVGPTGVGPGRLVQLTASGEIGPARSTALAGPEIRHRITLPVSLSFDIDLGVEVQQFSAEMDVPLVVAVRAAEGLRIFLEIDPPDPQDIGVHLTAHGLRASVFQRVAGVEDEVRRFVARYVATEVTKPHVMRARTIDVAHAIDAAWDSVAPQGASGTARSIADDFEDAAEQELRTSARD